MNRVAITGNVAYPPRMFWPRFAMLLCLGCALLSACKGTRDYVREKYTGERLGEDVPGPRRLPVLNNGYIKTPPPQVISQPAAAKSEQTAAAAKPAAPTPYDQYDADGNDTSRKNYLKSWLGETPPEAGKKPEQPSAPVASTGMRKRFSGDVVPVVSAPTEVAPPVAMLPEKTSVATEVLVPPPAIPQAPALSKQVPIKKPVPPKRSAVPEEDNSVVVPDFPPRTENMGDAQMAALQPAAGGNPAAEELHLSTVPRAPEQFRDVRNNKKKYERELQGEQDKAIEHKKLLEEEPTELKPISLPQVEGLLKEIDQAIHSDVPIIQAAK